MPEALSAQDIQDLQQIAQSLPASDPRLRKISLLLNSQPTEFERENAGEGPSLLGDPTGYLQKRITDLQGEAQRQQNLYRGPEGEQMTAKAQGALAKGATYLKRFGHGVLSAVPETAAAVDKAALALMDPKTAAAVAAGAINPTIPAAYFATQGTADLTGIGTEGPGLIRRAINEPSAENIQNALLAGSAVAGAVAGGASPRTQVGIDLPKVISNRLQPAAENLYKSSLKPSTSLSIPETQAMVRTGLTNEIPISAAGVERLWSLVDDLNSKVTARLQEGNTAGVEVNTKRVASRVDDLNPRFREQANPEADLNALASSKREFLNQHTQVQPYTKIRLADEGGGFAPAGPGEVRTVQNMPAMEAQRIKQGTYRKLADEYGDLSTAAKESQKAIARGIREELSQAFPEIDPLNARESALLNLEPELERAVQRVTNHQKVSLGTAMSATAGKAITGSNKAAAVAGVMKAVLDHPSIKSKIAINLHLASKGALNRKQAAARVQFYVNSLGAAANSEDNQ
ncbi:MAG TPA: hypothetical protein VN577_08975 [Terriglobales bacterium]|nr:hypothetical protein [Terriglobales bacterium]